MTDHRRIPTRSRRWISLLLCSLAAKVITEAASPAVSAGLREPKDFSLSSGPRPASQPDGAAAYGPVRRFGSLRIRDAARLDLHLRRGGR